MRQPPLPPPPQPKRKKKRRKSLLLSFLGFGVQPPAPDWGLMISEARGFVMLAPWIVLFPALAIGILVVAVNIFADGLGPRESPRDIRYL